MGGGRGGGQGVGQKFSRGPRQKESREWPLPELRAGHLEKPLRNSSALWLKPLDNAKRVRMKGQSYWRRKPGIRGHRENVA